MAQKTIITLEDDIDGGEADETVSFALDGVTYEIDLTAANANALRGVFHGYAAQARKVGKRRVPAKASSKSRGTSGGGASAAEIRAWGRDNGFEVPARGRVPAEVRAAFEAAS